MARISFVVSLMAAVGAVSLLAACHTVAGAGEDVSSAGHAVTGAADKALH
jgi:predicted small secreted protein